MGITSMTVSTHNEQSLVRETNCLVCIQEVVEVVPKIPDVPHQAVPSTDNTLFNNILFVAGLNIGKITILPNKIIEEYVLQGYLPLLVHKLPVDSQNQAFPNSLFNYNKT